MELGYFFYYAEANIVCIAILAILLGNDLLHSTKQEKQIWFNRTIVAHILYFLSDIGWAAVLGGKLQATRLTVIFFNLLNFVFLSLITYEWFMYMAASENMAFRKDGRKRMLCLLPLIITSAVMVIAYAAAPYFWVSENAELSVWYYPLMIAAPVCYLLASFCISMKNAGKAESREDRNLFRLIGIYPLALLGFGLIQIFAVSAPLFCFGCTTMMLFFYIRHMQMLVSVDDLTRMNNRGQISRYMEQARFRDTEDLYAVMLDIDRFKEINDTHGHAEGDRALMLVSDVLRQTAEHAPEPVFIGRYGGDEFTLFLQTARGEDAVAEIIREIRARLQEKSEANKLPYDLRISIGYDRLRDREDTAEKSLARADEKLYEDKKARGIQR